MNNPQNNLYFAYGSNLNSDDWAKWCQTDSYDPNCIHAVGPAKLPDYRVAFSHRSQSRNGGVLDVQPEIGCVLPGVLFQVSPEGWQALDEKEGASRAYRREHVYCIDQHGQVVQAATYVVDKPEPFVAPSPDYVDTVVAGLERHLMPTDHILTAQKELPARPVKAVFAYGTLMREESHHSLMDGLECALLAELPGRLIDCGSYPALQLGGQEAEDAMVQGEFLRFADNALLGRIDQYEGFRGYDAQDNLFVRIPVAVHVGDGRLRDAWTYVGCADLLDRGSRIPSGSWRIRNGNHQEFVERLLAAHLAGSPAASEKYGQDTCKLAEDVVGGKVSERKIAQRSKLWKALC